MGWIAAAIVFVGLLLKAPRLVAGIISVGIILTITATGVFQAYVWWDDHRQQALANKIFATIHAGQERCSKQFSLLVVYNNNGDRTVNVVSFDIEAREYGYSDVVRRGRHGQYRSDRILNPGDRAEICFAYPGKSYAASQDRFERLQPERLDWSISVGSVSVVGGN